MSFHHCIKLIHLVAQIEYIPVSCFVPVGNMIFIVLMIILFQNMAESQIGMDSNSKAYCEFSNVVRFLGKVGQYEEGFHSF